MAQIRPKYPANKINSLTTSQLKPNSLAYKQVVLVTYLVYMIVSQDFNLLMLIKLVCLTL